jgi:E3 ubiquitin-protein ligase EDD1
LSSLDDAAFNAMTLLDGNATFYPLNDISGSLALKEPHWKNLFPVKCFAQSLLVPTSQATNTNANKRVHYISAFCMRVEQLMSHIYRCDYTKVSKLVRQLESELAQLGSNQNSKRLRRLLNERSDGNRNIMHAAVYICAPGSHKTNGTQDKQSANESAATTGLAEIYAA